MSGNASYDSDNVDSEGSQWVFTFIGFCLLLIGVLGTLENLLALFIFVKSKQLRSPTNVFIIGVITSDLAMALLANPLATMNAFNGSWFVGEFLCYWEGFLVYFLGLAVLYLLTAVSVDRYIVIAKPLQAAKITRRVAVMAVLACYAGGLLWSLFPFFGWSSYGVELAGFFCGLHYADQSVSNSTYIIAIFFFCFVLPMGIMIYCYFKVFMTVRHVSRNTVWDMKSRLARKNLRIEKKMLRTCIIMCSVYWLCWFPYAVVSFWQAFGNVDDLPLIVTALPAVAAKSELVWNPIVYVATNKQFRTALYENLPCTGLRDALVKREEVKEVESEESDLDEKKKETEETQAAQKPTNTNAVAPTTTGPTKVEC